MRRQRLSRAAVAHGYTLIEVLCVAMLVAVVAGMAVPQALAGIERARTVGAARYLAGRLARARSEAVLRGSNVAVLLAPVDGTVILQAYVDGNRNGVRSLDISSGADRALAEAVRFDHLFPGVRLFLSDSQESVTSSPVMMSFAAIGTASSRTLYVVGRDQSRYAVRVLGATGRVRVLRFVPGTGDWTEVL